MISRYYCSSYWFLTTACPRIYSAKAAVGLGAFEWLAFSISFALVVFGIIKGRRGEGVVEDVEQPTMATTTATTQGFGRFLWIFAGWRSGVLI